MKKNELAARRHRFEQRIIQERLQIAGAVRDWRESTAPIDQGWQQLARYKGPILLGSGLLVTMLSRNKGRVGRLFKRSVVVYTMARRAKKMIGR
ncbi:YqjK family protein [Kushneria indalinina]|uniref:YqjK-like protein n=1 Tax=Kushneria indalinina DSM 14324 TaxID=1122140 RepID=A0A3D9DV14_9GAMM|nr:YqjK family protein [Kushneria indalinina]REC94495.1 YqjK-like protein [Kushneria indalinina DSM 14324]